MGAWERRRVERGRHSRADMRYEPKNMKLHQPKGSGLSEMDIILSADLRALHVGVVEKEYRFEPTRRWRSDYAIPKAMLLIECEGGTWQISRHTTGTGFQNDCDKYNHASALGWTVFRFTTSDILNGKAHDFLLLWKRNFLTNP